jgi:hypothetical protein
MTEIFHATAVGSDISVNPAKKEIFPRLPVPPEQPRRPPPRGTLAEHEQETADQPLSCREFINRPFPPRGTVPIAPRGVPILPTAEYRVTQPPVKRGRVAVHAFLDIQ